MKDLFILGTSGLAREIAMVIEHINAEKASWNLVGFVGKSGCTVGENLGRAFIVGDDNWLLSQKSVKASVVIGVGYPDLRAKIIQKYLDNGENFEFPNIFHPSVIMDKKTLNIGHGNVIFPGCVLTCNITIGNFNFINYNVTIGHDVEIGDYNVINPGSNISGYVKVGKRTLIGVGVQILEKLSVDSDVIVGAGAVVTKDVAGRQTVIGIPARPISSK